jgi:hypothetical protein
VAFTALIVVEEALDRVQNRLDNSAKAHLRAVTALTSIQASDFSVSNIDVHLFLILKLEPVYDKSSTMPCRDETHIHDWPTEGTIEICKCEIFCGYCTGDAAKVVYEHPWQLRGHIREHAQKEGLAIKVSPQPPKT